MGKWRVKYDGVCSRCDVVLRVAVVDRPRAESISTW
jgi:hypothetical protein